MKRIIIFLLLAFTFSGIALAVPIETQPSTSQMARADYVFRADSEDSTTFYIASTATDSTGIFYAWKNMSFEFHITGTSPNVKIRFYGGHSGNVTKSPSVADTLEFNFDFMDSVTYTETGTKSYMPSINMNVCKMIYAVIEGLAGNGADTVLDKTVLYRERW